jgi:phosphoenolpyruvate carboxykinase (ATP)
MDYGFKKVFRDLTSDALIEHALNNKEGELASNGALNALTGKRTGRSPKDRYIVKDDVTKDTVDWGKVNQPMTPETFAALWQEAVAYLQDKNVYIGHYAVGADKALQIPVEVITEYAWHNLFAMDLFIRKTDNQEAPQFTVLSAPDCLVDAAKYGLNSETAVVLNFAERKILIRGTRYAGEMKKAMFSVLNFLLPNHDVLPMHCSANMGDDGNVVIFFGLSGTGKTTLSADPKRHLIGDDEHGWSKTSVFNFEGGCYAKCINLSEKNEPMIYHAIRRGSVMENVVLDPNTKAPDYSDSKYTENTRVAYPRDFIEGCVPENRGPVPNAVIFLTCDLFGVIPPVAILTKEQAAYYFLSGYTALVGSTEMGSAKGVTTTFSVCFGAPFFPRPAQVYADLLMKRVEEDNAQVYLVNTGWSGGGYGTGGARFSIPTTRSIIDGILSGDILKEPTTLLPGFNLKIPTKLQDVDSKLLDPRLTWQDQGAYQQALATLIAKFKENFTKFSGVSAAIQQAEPGDFAD